MHTRARTHTHTLLLLRLRRLSNALTWLPLGHSHSHPGPVRSRYTIVHNTVQYIILAPSWALTLTPRGREIPGDASLAAAGVQPGGTLVVVRRILKADGQSVIAHLEALSQSVVLRGRV